MRVRAAPADGAANEAVIKTVAETCDVAPSRVAISRGAAGRLKLIEIRDADGEAIRRRWPGLAVS